LVGETFPLHALSLVQLVMGFAEFGTIQLNANGDHEKIKVEADVT